MTKQAKFVNDLVDLIEKCRAAQVLYFKIRKGEIKGTTQREQEKALRNCMKLEGEIDEWISLYRAEEARWKGWIAAHYPTEQLEQLTHPFPADEIELAPHRLSGFD